MRKKTYSLNLWKKSKGKQSERNKSEQTEPAKPAITYIPNPTCSTLKLSAFIKITTSGDLSHLGNVEDPETAWQEIHSEYCQLSQDTQSSRALELAKQISYYSSRISITLLCVDYLQHRGYVAELVDELKNMGYRIPFQPDTLVKDLERVIGLSKSDQVKLAHATEQYQKLTKDGAKNEVTVFDWYRMLSALAKHRQVPVISADAITVTEYCAMDLDLREYVAAMKSM